MREVDAAATFTPLTARTWEAAAELRATRRRRCNCRTIFNTQKRQSAIHGRKRIVETAGDMIDKANSCEMKDGLFSIEQKFVMCQFELG
jgi:hypothetical protein